MLGDGEGATNDDDDGRAECDGGEAVKEQRKNTLQHKMSFYGKTCL